MITREEALKLLEENLSNQNLVKHSLASEAVMRALARYLGENEEEWGLAGLLHDLDAQSRNKLIGEKIISYGVRTKEIRKIIKKYWKEYPELKTTAVCFTTAEKLISTKNLDSKLAGIFLLGLYQKNLAIKDISWLEKLITKNINNWAVTDTLAGEVLAPVLKNSPKKNNLLYDWLNSENIWLKRAALVTTVKLKNKVENWEELAFKMLSLAEKEKEPLVKKAAHWLEKAVTP
jgi:3-methyladenine DNA glycosylase AlkD